jgi:deoxyribodipyrimidine photo-lyase
MKQVPSTRIRVVNEAEINAKGAFVLYWMTHYRRLSWNFSLDRAIEWANDLKKPLLIVEELRVTSPWASDRFHKFTLQGMAESEKRLKEAPVRYYPYLEQKLGESVGLLRALFKDAAVVITDDFPASNMLPNAKEIAETVSVLLEAIDSNGLFPVRSTDKIFQTAYSFRRFLQKELPKHFLSAPETSPLKKLRASKPASVSRTVLRKWPAVKVHKFLKQNVLSSLPINHDIVPVPMVGGPAQAQKTLRMFIRTRLTHYSTDRNDATKNVNSGLSPYLHFGHISTHQIFRELMDSEGWTPDYISLKCDGRRSGWWGIGQNAEAFLDQLITWREIGFNRCTLQKDFDQYDSLPTWSQETLGKHASDPRPFVYTRNQFEQAKTHDPLWNAAQKQLIEEGIIHNYLRMLWGKKILEWSPTPQKALKTMIELNDKYALDGQDPNSYSGIFWILGRYDRPWGPERPIFGTVRYMSSESTKRKMRVAEYIERYAA